MAYIVVTGAGTDCVNGTYKDIGNNTFELASVDRADTVYRIEIDQSKEENPFGNCVILTQNRKNDLAVTLYLNQNCDILTADSNEDLNKNWVCICGIEPTPTFDKVTPRDSDKRDSKDKEFDDLFLNEAKLKQELFVENMQNKKKEKGKRKDKIEQLKEEYESKRVLYWSRKFENWTQGLINEINRNDTTSDEYILVERDLTNLNINNFNDNKENDNINENENDVTTASGLNAINENEDGSVNVGLVRQRNFNELTMKQKETINEYEKIYIKINSHFLRPYHSVMQHCESRKLKKNTCVRVWSRKELKWLKGVITQCDQGYVFADCQEPRWIQENSCLIQSL